MWGRSDRPHARQARGAALSPRRAWTRPGGWLLPTLDARFTFAEVRAAALVCGLVVLATFPVVIPYLVFDDPHVARRASNAVSIVLLYICGHILGRHCGARPFRTGLLMVAIGAVLVLTILALGG